MNINCNEIVKPLNTDNVDFSSIELDGIDHRDYPDYCDAYVSYAEFKDGTPLTDDQMDELTDIGVAQELMWKGY